MGLPIHLFLLFPVVFLLEFMPREIFHPMIILIGQAHIMMGYYYKFGSHQAAMKYRMRIILLLAIAVPTYILAYNYTAIMIFCMATLFLAHFLLDEMELFDAEKSRANLLSILPALVIMTFYLFDVEFDTAYYDAFNMQFLMLGILAFAYTLFFNRNSFALYVTGIAVIVALYLYAYDFNDIHLFFAFAMSHYLNWYVYLAIKFKKKDGGKYRRYLYDIALFNGAMVLLFIAAQNYEFLGFLNTILFSIPAFYAATFLHCIAMYRSEDLGAFKPLMAR